MTRRPLPPLEIGQSYLASNFRGFGFLRDLSDKVPATLRIRLSNGASIDVLPSDEDARALRDDGSVIEGLYAAGNVSAPVMGHTYPGPGGTIGPAMAFGYLAALHIAGAARPATLDPGKA